MLVVNIKTTRDYDVYIGRPPRWARDIGHYGNPFSHLMIAGTIKVPTREEAVAAYRDWLTGQAWQTVEPARRQWILAHLKYLKGKRLACFCAPLACHGDVLEELAEAS